MPHIDQTHLLTPLSMSMMDQDAVNSGIPSIDLMERAGLSVAALALREYPEANRFVVLCGPGNNGGDGYVAARGLIEAGANVAIFYYGDYHSLKCDAAIAAQKCNFVKEPLRQYELRNGDVVIDALFGAGLNKSLSTEITDIIRDISHAALPVISIDLPSGVCGLTGKVIDGVSAFKAEHTISFMVQKIGHVLMPGRQYCGKISIFDIGIPARVVLKHVTPTVINNNAIWSDFAKRSIGEIHKYTKGHVSVFSGGVYSTGAAQLSAQAALRSGAGVVTVLAPSDAMELLSHKLTSIMLHEVDQIEQLHFWLADKRHETFVLGPAFGDLVKAQKFVNAIADRNLVLDADAITAFRADPDVLFSILNNGGQHILTPHEGEFSRLFPDVYAQVNLSKLDQALIAAKRAHSVIIYKGSDSVIASPDGRSAINISEQRNLATAGSGDVLTGVCAANLARGMPAYEAACGAVFQHCRAAALGDDGLTADQLSRLVAPL